MELRDCTICGAPDCDEHEDGFDEDGFDEDDVRDGNSDDEEWHG